LSVSRGPKSTARGSGPQQVPPAKRSFVPPESTKNGSGEDPAMASNNKKIFITQTLAPCGRALLNARDDIELIEFPNLISASDFEALLKQHAPVHGVALGATRFGETELEAAKDMKVVTR